MYGHRKAPGWIVQIEAARQWFTQPWKIAGGTKTLWYARFEAIREAEVKRGLKVKADMKRNSK